MFNELPGVPSALRERDREPIDGTLGEPQLEFDSDLIVAARETVMPVALRLVGRRLSARGGGLSSHGYHHRVTGPLR
jgi:hypothetical protein